MPNSHCRMPDSDKRADQAALRRRALLTVGAGLVLGAGGLVPQPALSQGGGAIRVAAASDLKFALGSIADTYQRETGLAVTLSFGSSGNFAQQISQGLPVDLFMSADESYVFRLARAGLTRALGGQQTTGTPVYDRGQRYATGRIALLLPAASTIAADAGLKGLRAAWPQVRKFALANPEHAPYGRAAQQALVSLGLWEMVQPRLVLGENIAQATQFVTSGAAQAGITALSLALADDVARSTRHALLGAQLHQPLHQRMVLLPSAGTHARAFYEYLRSPGARAVLARFGFSEA